MQGSTRTSQRLQYIVSYREKQVNNSETGSRGLTFVRFRGLGKCIIHFLLVHFLRFIKQYDKACSRNRTGKGDLMHVNDC